MRYVDPRPSPTVAAFTTALNRVVFLDGLPQIGIGGRQGIAELVIHQADARRLRDSLGGDDACFVAPNHPEYLTDWAIDKELVARFGPDTAMWADRNIVNAHPLLQRFWLANHLVANVPGGGGKAYSVAWAARGGNVLLHPEGHVAWTGDRIQPLLPGIADMACQTARRVHSGGEARRVRIQPVVWKLRFVRDVTASLHHEIADLEAAHRLPRGTGLDLGERFGALQAHLLRARERAFGRTPGADADYRGDAFFARQEAQFVALRTELCRRYVRPDGSRYLQVARLRRQVRAQGQLDTSQRERDLAMVSEMSRCLGTRQDSYGGAVLTQEQIAESLLRLRQQTLTRTPWQRLRAKLPRPVAPRVATVHAPHPIEVHAGADPAQLTLDLRRRMQDGLDHLGDTLRPLQAPHACPNPFAGSATRLPHRGGAPGERRDDSKSRGMRRRPEPMGVR